MKLTPNKIRVRFAPSPTGDPHIGNMRTALFDYLFAKSTGGGFILRIEDTDRSRFVEGSIEKILESLEWLGIMPDEGVVLKNGKNEETGSFGPYYQSERLDIYQKYSKQLIDSSHAYRCQCTEEKNKKAQEVALKKSIKDGTPPIYRCKCRDLNLTDEKLPIRLKVPLNEKISFIDEIHGKIEIDLNSVNDQILLKSDGFPTYHLAVVVDDYLMKITHVFRGQEWISSTVKHILLYRFFGWEKEIPKFIHLPLILDSHKTKLSKRSGAKSALNYREDGYLSEALVNFLALLGWAPGQDREIMTLSEMVEIFSLDQVNKAPAVFDIQKLNHFNGLYIRKLSVAELGDRLLEWAPDESRLIKWAENRHYFEKALKTIQERMVTLADAENMLEFYFKKPNYKAELLFPKNANQLTTSQALSASLSSLSSVSSWTLPDLEQNLRALAEKLGIKAGQILWPIRVALTGLEKSPSTFEVLEVLGKEKSLERIEKAIKKLTY